MARMRPHDIHAHPWPPRTEQAIDTIRSAALKLRELEIYYGFTVAEIEAELPANVAWHEKNPARGNLIRWGDLPF